MDNKEIKIKYSVRPKVQKFIDWIKEDERKNSYSWDKYKDQELVKTLRAIRHYDPHFCIDDIDSTLSLVIDCGDILALTLRQVKEIRDGVLRYTREGGY